MDYDLRKAFGKIEDELMGSMMRNLKRHLEEQEKEGFDWPQWQAMQLRSLENYKKDNRRIFDPKFQSINEDIEDAIREMAKQGASDQEIEILETLANNKKMRRRHTAGQGVKAADENFFEINQDKLEALVNATTNDMSRAEQAVLRRANDQYRKVIFDAQVYANTGAGTVEKAVDMAAKDFLSRGIDSIVYRDGSRHTIKDYADMAIRTAERRAYLYGEGQKRQEWGEHLVIAMERGGGCPLCKPWQGKVLIDDVYSGGEPDGVHTLLSTAMAQGFLHPRCKDGLSTYFPGISTKPDTATKADIQKAVRQQAIDNRKNLIERQVQKYDRLAKYSLDLENKAGYAAKRDKWKTIEDSQKSYRYPDSEGLFITQINPRIEDKGGEMVQIKTDVIKPHNIIKSLNKSEAGKNAYKYIQENGLNVYLRYNVDNPLELSGEYDPITRDIVVYGDVTKTIEETASTIVHEAMHDKLGHTGTQKEEVRCFMEEYRYKGIPLTMDRVKAIIKAVKRTEVYKDLPWR